MKIIRDGKEYELTREELLSAYLEQERIYDIGNIRDNMEGYLPYEQYERLKGNETFISLAADKLRYNQDNLGIGYDAALTAAFKDAAKEFFDKRRGAETVVPSPAVSKPSVGLSLAEQLKDAAAIEYKGIIFDDWTVDDDNNVWAEMCEGCAEKHKELISAELDDGGAIGICSVRGCEVSGLESDNARHYYIDFKPEFIHPLTKEQLLEMDAEAENKSKPSLEDQIQSAAARVDNGSIVQTHGRSVEEKHDAHSNVGR